MLENCISFARLWWFLFSYSISNIFKIFLEVWSLHCRLLHKPLCSTYKEPEVHYSHSPKATKVSQIRYLGQGPLWFWEEHLLLCPYRTWRMTGMSKFSALITAIFKFHHCRDSVSTSESRWHKHCLQHVYSNSPQPISE